MNKERDEGARAYRQGQSEDDCPYPTKSGASAERIEWFNGFFETRIGDRLKRAFNRLGITWP